MSNERRSQQAVKPERPEPVPQLAELAETNKRLKRKIFDLYTIFEISRHLNSVLNTQTLLDAIILTCIGQMGVNGAAIFIVRGQGSDELALAKHKGLSLPPSRELLIAGDSPVFRLFHESHGKPLSFDEIRSTIGETPEVAVLSSVECAYLIPMSLQGRIRGLLSVTRKISGAGFLDDDLEFLSILANQLSVAIENARLFDSEKEALEKLRTTQLQLVQAEKLAALGQLSARVAHEVNNPLGIIKNYLLMIRQQCNQDKDAEKFVEIVTEEVDRIAGIVRQLLDMFRPQPDTFGSTDVGAVLEETLLLLSLHAQKGRIKIDKKLPRQFPRIYGSAEQLKQVFLNILINACDFMPSGGKIQIDGSVVDGQVTISFTDSGPGISKDHLDKIFEPFFTTKGAGRGTGLGLSVCQSIVKAHQGSIVAGNVAGAGARFTVLLPIERRDGEK